MGWITDRKTKTGHGLNSNPKNNGSNNGPLRLVIRYIRIGTQMFDRSWVEMECGHEGPSTGGIRARCRKCKITT